MTAKEKSYIQALTSLQQKTWRFWLISVGVLLFSYSYLIQYWGPDFAKQWVVTAFGILVLQLIVLFKALPYNHRLGEAELLPKLGPGNWLSVIRSLLIAMIAGFIFLPRPPGGLVWIPAGLYLLAGITDFFDGYLARLSDHVTQLGARLDLHNDSFGVVVVTLLAFQYGVLPGWYVWFGFARYIFLFGLWLRRRFGMQIYELQPSMTRRGFAALQMGFITVMLFPGIGPPATFLAAGVFLALFAGRFIYDWLQVSGQIGSHGIWKNSFWNIIRNRFSKIAPLVFRATAVIILLLGFVSQSRNLDEWLLLFNNLDPIFRTVTILEFPIMLLLVLGIAGRTTAGIALVMLGIKIQSQSLTLELTLLVGAYIGILFLGTGRYSVWSPEDWLLVNKAGEKRKN